MLTFNSLQWVSETIFGEQLNYTITLLFIFYLKSLVRNLFNNKMNQRVIKWIKPSWDNALYKYYELQLLSDI